MRCIKRRLNLRKFRLSAPSAVCRPAEAVPGAGWRSGFGAGGSEGQASADRRRDVGAVNVAAGDPARDDRVHYARIKVETLDRSVFDQCRDRVNCSRAGRVRRALRTGARYGRLGVRAAFRARRRVVVLPTMIPGADEVDVAPNLVFRACPKDLQDLVVDVGGGVDRSGQDGEAANRPKTVRIGIAW